MDLAQRITAVLTPHLGPTTADVVARHLCAKHGLGPEQDELAPERLHALRVTLEQGLVAFVGKERAQSLAADCFQDVSGVA